MLLDSNVVLATTSGSYQYCFLDTNRNSSYNDAVKKTTKVGDLCPYDKMLPVKDIQHPAFGAHLKGA